MENIQVNHVASASQISGFVSLVFDVFADSG